jgi:arginine decarboxylase
MPGHKLGRGLPKELLADLSMLDLTEIPGTDNLFYPTEAIKEGQMLAANAFGADRTYFLVNGSTGGIHAMIMTICKPKDKLIVARDCHKSVVNGMLLADVNPVYISPEFDNEFGISLSITPSQVEKAFKDNPDAVGLLITRPNYYGVCCDIEKIAKIVQEHNKILAVDEAHGAHLIFSGRLPVAAMGAGADICVQSAHKTLPAFTQGAYLHVKTNEFKANRIDTEKLEYNLRLLMTSSPSYIILASLDVARSVMQKCGEDMLDELLNNLDKFYKNILKTEGIKTLNEKYSLLNKSETDNIINKTNAENSYDKTRIVINFMDIGLSGFRAADILRKQFNIQVEMSDTHNIICICTISDTERELEALRNAVGAIVFKYGQKINNKKESDSSNNCESKTVNPSDVISKMPDLPPQKIRPNEAAGKDKVWIKISDAVGKVCAEMVVPYPPGVPVICPGEIILDDTIGYICSIIELGGNVTGLKDNSKICVIRG